jgi:tetratricopeptide (TPR) repeat protein
MGPEVRAGSIAPSIGNSQRGSSAMAMKSFVALCIAMAVPTGVAFAVDNEISTTAPDLTSVRASIKAKDFDAALAQLNGMIDRNVQHADVYNLLGFSLRKTGDYAKALTFYKKALDFDANHKGAHEYLGELYVETGQLAKAREHLATLERLCPQGCEERDDLAKAIGAALPKTN